MPLEFINMEEYVDKIGDLNKKHFKKKDLDDLAGIALKELGTHTDNLTKLDEERRAVRLILDCD